MAKKKKSALYPYDAAPSIQQIVPTPGLPPPPLIYQQQIPQPLYPPDSFMQPMPGPSFSPPIIHQPAACPIFDGLASSPIRPQLQVHPIKQANSKKKNKQSNTKGKISKAPLLPPQRVSFEEKKKIKRISKLKNKINQLLEMGGELSEEQLAVIHQTQAIIEGERKTGGGEADVSATLDVKTTSRAHLALNKVITNKRVEKNGGPALLLTLNKLNGNLVDNFAIGQLVHFSLIGSPVVKPRMLDIRPWKALTQTVLVRVNCPNHYIFFEKRWIKLEPSVSNRHDFWTAMLQVPSSIREQIREKMLKMDPEKGVKCTKAGFVLTSIELIENEYPFPDKTNNIIPTKKRYLPLSESSPIFAVDCEMCITSSMRHELCRISLIREDGSVVFDTLVKPDNRIVNYLTEYSGITEEMLEGVDVTLADVQAAIQAVLPADAILVGHSMQFDLKCMKMAHPYCIDVAVSFSLSGGSSKSSLKNLVYIFLNKSIQNGVGHCSVEDAWAAMQLAKLKFDNGLIFGNCRFGWNFDEWNGKRKASLTKIEAEEPAKKKATVTRNEKNLLGEKPNEKPHVNLGENQEENANIMEINGTETGEAKQVKKEENTEEKKAETKKPKCVCMSCGVPFGIDCIVEGCLCQLRPPNFCVKCLGRHASQPALNEKSGYDWREALRVDNTTKSRPLSYYMIDSKKTVMCGFEIPEGQKLPENGKFTHLSPTSSDSLEAFIEQCAGDLMAHGLAMVDLDYTQLANDTENAADEEGELIDPIIARMEIARQIDEHADKLIRASGKFALVMFVFSSPESNILYMRVKP